jgi:hypothetical protein
MNNLRRNLVAEAKPITQAARYSFYLAFGSAFMPDMQSALEDEFSVCNTLRVSDLIEMRGG